MPEVTAGWTVKCPQFFIKAMCEHSAQVAGIDQFHEDMRLTDAALCQVTSETLESFERQDWTVLHTGITSTASAITQLPGEGGQWVMAKAQKQRTAEGLLFCRYTTTPLEYLYFGWPAKLDFEKQLLWVAPGIVLKARDLTLLHKYLLGVPRKVIAAQAFLSVKAIEKRLTHLRELLAHPSSPDDSLHTALHKLHLIPFLLAQADWFDMRCSHIIHK